MMFKTESQTAKIFTMTGKYNQGVGISLKIVSEAYQDQKFSPCLLTAFKREVSYLSP